MLFGSLEIPFTWGYKPITDTAITWSQLSNGNWRGVDRGQAADIYQSQISFVGTESELSDLETFLNSNRVSFSATITEKEAIFGANIDYSSPLTVYVSDYSDVKRISFNQYAMELRLLLDSPTFATITPLLSVLKVASYTSTQQTNFTIKNHVTYDGEFNLYDSLVDDGFFECIFTQTLAEMKQIREYLRTTARASTITFPTISGIDKPWGQRTGTPTNCKIISWEDLGRINYIDYGIKLKFAREY
jgi:hypothetical protein